MTANGGSLGNGAGQGASRSGGTSWGGSGTGAGIATGGGMAPVGGSDNRGIGGEPGAGGASSGGAGTGATTSNSGGSSGNGSGGGGSKPAIVDCPETYHNPIIWEDLPDLEVIRVDDTYYYTASTFHHSPGAPVLKSYDLVNWEYVGHSVPRLDFDPSYDLDGGVSYRNGIWASTLQYRESNQTFYWMGCMHGTGGGYVFTAPSATGPWEKHESSHCYYDMGLLVDDDDTLYVAYGNGTIHVAQLSADGFSQVKDQQVYETPGDLSGPLEGARFLKRDDYYYIFLTQYANGEYVIRSTDPFGPYEMRPFAVQVPYAPEGSGASPHQGGVVETQQGQWYYIAFNDSYPGGRLPVMAPMNWVDGWPELVRIDNEWGAEYPFPDVTCRALESRPSLDTFSEEELSPEWEWNHNPDNSRWSTGNGLTLQTATVTSDIYRARNTLTRRIEGPISVGTIELDFSGMQDGDVAGLAAWRDSTAFIAVTKSGDNTQVEVRQDVNLSNEDWSSTTPGTQSESDTISGDTIWLRLEANIRTDVGGATAVFFYSTDGVTFTQLGSPFSLRTSWNYFLGYRFGIFNYATESLGGQVTIRSFSIEKP